MKAHQANDQPCESCIRHLLIVEDDAKLRSSIERILLDSDRINIVSNCGTLKEAKLFLKKQPVSVVLLDIGLPDGSGLDLLPWVGAHAPQTLPIILSSFSDEETVVRAIELGAQGYLVKDADPDQLLAALDDIVRGVPPLSASIAQCILRHIKHRAANSDSLAPGEKTPAPETPRLPARLQQALELLARGLTYQEIAERMEISFHTVSSYAQEIYNKLAVRSRGEAVFEARRLRLLAP